jgi:hypothetical protein
MCIAITNTITIIITTTTIIIIVTIQDDDDLESCDRAGHGAREVQLRRRRRARAVDVMRSEGKLGCTATFWARRRLCGFRQNQWHCCR